MFAWSRSLLGGFCEFFCPTHAWDGSLSSFVSEKTGVWGVMTIGAFGG